MPGRRILIVCPEPLGAVLTGVGIRLSEMARVLAARHDVTLAAPEVSGDLGLPCSVRPHGPADLPALLGAADVAIVHGHVGNEVLAASPRCPLVFDLYDPFVVENLAYAEELGPAVFRFDRLTLERQLRSGDFFLCASDAQRAFYLGMLTLLARVSPATYGKGRDLRHLIAVAPFGVPEPARCPPPGRSGAWRRRLGLGDGPAIFFGGIYDWYDPVTALRALARVREEAPGARLVLVRNPREATTPQAAFARARASARELALGDAVVEADWIPYAERGEALADMDLGLVSHRVGIETDLSFRTRILDFLWAGLPVVASAGGGGSDLVERAGAGTVVPCGDAGAMASAVLAMARDPGRAREMGRAGRDWVLAHMTWERAMAPLLAWLEEPAPDPHKPPLPDEPVPRSWLDRLLRG